MKKKVFTLLATSFAGIAIMIVSMASWTFVHQAETPDELLQ